MEGERERERENWSGPCKEREKEREITGRGHYVVSQDSLTQSFFFQYTGDSLEVAVHSLF